MSNLIPPFDMPAVNRQVLLIARPAGIPVPSDFDIRTAPLPVAGPGQALVRNIYLSVDPAQRGWASDAANYSAPVPLGSAMRALAIGQVVESDIDHLLSGAFVYGWFGWQDYAAIGPADILTRIGEPAVPLSAYAGPLGINGLTALLAFFRLGHPRSDDTVVVSTAAGAVGSIVGQLARSAGCRTIGLTGSAAKVELCRGRFGYDAAIDYKTADVGAAIKQFAPDGIDIFFDSVGGTTLDIMLRNMRTAGRIVQCGTASIASWNEIPVGPRVEREVLTRRLQWSGFVVFDHAPEFPGALQDLAQRIVAGTLVYDEDIANGIDACPGALEQIYAGENRGKKLVYVG